MRLFVSRSTLLCLVFLTGSLQQQVAADTTSRRRVRHRQEKDERKVLEAEDSTFYSLLKADAGMSLATPTNAPIAEGEPTAAPTEAPAKDFESTEDFETGSFVSVITLADSLQLASEAGAFNFIYVAASGRGTVVKIDTNTGAILGEYRTGPISLISGNPSRTTVDNDGSVWVANRNHNPGTIVHIGLEENNQCEDRNGNGVIDTSTGLGDIREWVNQTGIRGVQTAEDECIIHITDVNALGTRHVSINQDNDVWVSGTARRTWDLVKGGGIDESGSGMIIQGYASVGYGGYGGLEDRDGVIWSARPLLRWDPSNPLEGPNGDPAGSSVGPLANETNWAGQTSPDSYGLCLDSQGNVWATTLAGSAIVKYSSNGTFLGSYFHGNLYAQGCAVDLNDDVWVAHSLVAAYTTVGHVLNNGTHVGNVALNGGVGPTGISVDGNGKVWSANALSNSVSRIDPSLNGIGAVDLTVDLGPGASPYNYGDMTGSTLGAAPNTGSWTTVYDSGAVDQSWDRLGWTAVTPSDSAIVVEARTSANGTTFGAYEEAENGSSLSIPDGQFIQVRVRFGRASTGESPIVSSLRIFISQ